MFVLNMDPVCFFLTLGKKWWYAEFYQTVKYLCCIQEMRKLFAMEASRLA